MGYILLNCGPKKSHGSPQILQAIGKTISCSLQPEGKALLLKHFLMSLEHGGVKAGL